MKRRENLRKKLVRQLEIRCSIRLSYGRIKVGISRCAPKKIQHRLRDVSIHSTFPQDKLSLGMTVR